MKVRAGFVSNSSSSSFLIHGDCTTINQDIKDIISNFTDDLKFKIITYTRET